MANQSFKKMYISPYFTFAHDFRLPSACIFGLFLQPHTFLQAMGLVWPWPGFLADFLTKCTPYFYFDA